MKRMDKRKWIILAVVAAVLVLIGGAVAVKIVYDKGVESGRAQQREDVEDSLKQLGETITEKTEVLKMLSDLNGETSNEANSDNIIAYLVKLEKIVKKVKNEEAKGALESYLTEWKSLKDIYDKKDNNAIAEELEKLRSVASDTAMKVTEAYNKAITEAASKL